MFDQPLGRYLQFLEGDTWRPFGWDPALPEDPATGNVGLAAHAGTVQGALGLTATDVSAILADTGGSLDAAALNLATVSLLHRYAVLARRLGLPATDLITLRQLAGVDPFAPPPPGPVTTLADDHAAVTITFAGTVAAVRSAGLDAPALDYLLRHRFDPAGPYAPSDAAPLDLIRALDAEITGINTEQADPSDPTALSDEELRQKMALVLPAPGGRHVLRHVDRNDQLRRGAHRRARGGRAGPGAGRRPAGDHAQVRPGARRAAPDLHRRAGQRRAGRSGHALWRHPRSARPIHRAAGLRPGDRHRVLRRDAAGTGRLPRLRGLRRLVRATAGRRRRGQSGTDQAPGAPDRRVHAVPARPADHRGDHHDRARRLHRHLPGQ